MKKRKNDEKDRPRQQKRADGSIKRGEKSHRSSEEEKAPEREKALDFFSFTAKIVFKLFSIFESLFLRQCFASYFSSLHHFKSRTLFF